MLFKSKDEEIAQLRSDNRNTDKLKKVRALPPVALQQHVILFGRTWRLLMFRSRN